MQVLKICNLEIQNRVSLSEKLRSPFKYRQSFHRNQEPSSLKLKRKNLKMQSFIHHWVAFPLRTKTKKKLFSSTTKMYSNWILNGEKLRIEWIWNLQRKQNHCKYEIVTKEVGNTERIGSSTCSDNIIWDSH